MGTTCTGCNGTGELWTECCSGHRCPCEGKQVYLGVCRICHGDKTIPQPIGISNNPNIEFIRALATAGFGYIGNPYGRLR